MIGRAAETWRVKPLLWLAAVAVAMGCAAAGARPAPPVGPVLDLADVFPASDEVALNQRLTRYHELSGNTLMVATVTSLDGEAIDDYGQGLFKEWRIGGEHTGRGILVLLAPSERIAWIGIGCGFGDAITAEFGQQVMQTKMIPAYKQRHFEEGTLAAVDALIDHLASAPHDEKAVIDPNCRAGMVIA
jgi:uncharacterized protein